MKRFKVALVAYDSDEVPHWVIEQISAARIELVIKQCKDDDETLACAAGADLVWVFGGPGFVTNRILPSLKDCSVILRTGSGTDNIPVDAATELGIIVANTPEAAAHTVAEHALGLLLAVLRQIPVQDRAVRQGTWDRYHAFPKWHMQGQTLGLVGFGHIARLVVQKSAGFGLRPIASDPFIDPKTISDHGVEPVSFDDLLQRADFISLHTPLLDSTHHLIGERELALMKPQAVLINTSRGKIIDEAALAKALTEGQIAAAGLDVMEQQPPDPDNPLLKLDNIVITPHIAGYSDTYHDDFWSHSVRTVIEVAKTGRPLWIVNPKVKPRFDATS
jgi:D-3-phosphoglycerate dehydrogenase